MAVTIALALLAGLTTLPATTKVVNVARLPTPSDGVRPVSGNGHSRTSVCPPEDVLFVKVTRLWSRVVTGPTPSSISVAGRRTRGPVSGEGGTTVAITEGGGLMGMATSGRGCVTTAASGPSPTKKANGTAAVTGQTVVTRHGIGPHVRPTTTVRQASPKSESPNGHA